MFTVTISRTLRRRLDALSFRAEWERCLKDIATLISMRSRIHVGEWTRENDHWRIELRLEIDASIHEHQSILASIKNFADSVHWCNNPWIVQLPPQRMPLIRRFQRGSRWHVLAGDEAITPPDGVDRANAVYIQGGVERAFRNALQGA